MINFIEILKDNPVIAAVRNIDELEDVLKSEVEIVFILYGNIINIRGICKSIKECGKLAFVNVDMVQGLRGDKFGIEFIKYEVNPDGIISTNGHVLKVASAMGIFTVQRLFIIDSVSIETGLSIAKITKPNALEILPGVAFKAIEIINKRVNLPLITGGLINNQKDAVQALAAGAIGISTSSKALWEY